MSSLTVGTISATNVGTTNLPVSQVNVTTIRFAGGSTMTAAPTTPSLSQLGGVSISSPSNTQILQYNGSNWVNATLSISALNPSLLSTYQGTNCHGGQNNYQNLHNINLPSGVIAVSVMSRHYTAPSGDPDPGEIRINVPGITNDGWPWKAYVLEQDSTYENREETAVIWTVFKLTSGTSLTLEARTPDPDPGGVCLRTYFSAWKLGD